MVPANAHDTNDSQLYLTTRRFESLGIRGDPDAANGGEMPEGEDWISPAAFRTARETQRREAQRARDGYRLLLRNALDRVSDDYAPTKQNKRRHEEEPELTHPVEVSFTTDVSRKGRRLGFETKTLAFGTLGVGKRIQDPNLTEALPPAKKMHSGPSTGATNTSRSPDEALRWLMEGACNPHPELGNAAIHRHHTQDADLGAVTAPFFIHPSHPVVTYAGGLYGCEACLAIRSVDRADNKFRNACVRQDRTTTNTGPTGKYLQLCKGINPRKPAPWPDGTRHDSRVPVARIYATSYDTAHRVLIPAYLRPAHQPPDFMDDG